MTVISREEVPRTSAPASSQSIDSQMLAESSKKLTVGYESDVLPTSIPRKPLETKSHLQSHTAVENLPNELLSHILGFLDIPPPSASSSALHDEPTFALTQSEAIPLKAASCVSKLWRRCAMPLLFKHPQFVVAEPKKQSPALNDQIAPFFDFVTRNSLRKIISTFTLVVHDKKVSNNAGRKHSVNDFSTFWKSLFTIIDPVELLVIAPAEALGRLTSCHVHLEDVWSFDCPCHYLRLQRPPAPPVVTLPVEDAIPAKEYPMGKQTHQIVEPVTSNFSTGNIPEDLLNREHSIVAAQYNVEEASLDNPRRSSQPDASSAGPSNLEEPLEIPHGASSALFEIRPWSTLLLNEGSFIRAYATYEFWLRTTPSILSDLCGDDTPPRRGLISPTIRDMDYIGIFPMTSHFSKLTRHCPRLDRLYVQLVPRNDILQIPSKMQQVEAEDLWMERNSCYALLMRELFNAPPTQNYKFLQVFESGDAADTDAWHMAVEYVKRAANGWKVAQEGVFVRDPGDLAPEPEASDGEHSSLSVNSTTTGS